MIETKADEGRVERALSDKQEHGSSLQAAPGGQRGPVCRLIHTNALSVPYSHCQTTGHGVGGVCVCVWLYGPAAETRGSAKSKQSFKDRNKNNRDVAVALNPSLASSTCARAAARISCSNQKTHVLAMRILKVSFPVTPSHIANELELAHSIGCPRNIKCAFLPSLCSSLHFVGSTK